MVHPYFLFFIVRHYQVDMLKLQIVITVYSYSHVNTELLMSDIKSPIRSYHFSIKIF
jgi:hypothetical protein